MVSGSMPEGRIGITPSPGQDGSTVNDEITGTDEPSPERLHNDQDKQCLMQRRSSSMTTFALLGGALNARLSLFIQRQATGQSQSGPTGEPVMHVLIG
jgi:hypothetical protein